MDPWTYVKGVVKFRLFVSLQNQVYTTHIHTFIYTYILYSDILHLLTCWGSSSSYVYGALNNLQLPGTISDEAHGVLDDLQDRGLRRVAS